MRLAPNMHAVSKHGEIAFGVFAHFAANDNQLIA
jgi:hypothetical protein